MKKNTDLSENSKSSFHLSRSSRNENSSKVSIEHDNNNVFLAAKQMSQEFKPGSFINQLGMTNEGQVDLVTNKSSEHPQQIIIEETHPVVEEEEKMIVD